MFALGIVATKALGWYSLACLILTIVFLAGLLFSGKHANKLKRLHEFLSERISEMAAEKRERETRALQEELHLAKIEKQ